MRIIIYVLTVLVLVTSGIAFTQLSVNKVRKERIETLTEQLTTAKESLEQLNIATEASSAATAELVDKVSMIGEQGSIIKERVVYLERTNEKIRDLVALALPDDGCLLDNTCNAPIRWSEPSIASFVQPAEGSEVVDGARRGKQQQ